MKIVKHPSEHRQNGLLTPSPSLSATPVNSLQRPRFWSRHFGSVPHWIILEPRIFSCMDHLCARYRGGLWQFYTLSNGGAFIAPDTESQWSLFNPNNGNSASLSSEATGIAVCLLEYSHHACRTGNVQMAEHYYRLRDYALAHTECHTIMHITD